MPRENANLVVDPLTRSAFVFCGWLIVAVFLRVGPPVSYIRVQQALQASAGLVIAMIPASLMAEAPPAQPEEVLKLRAENQELRLQLAQARSALEASKAQQELPIKNAESLLESTLITARVLGRKGDALSGSVQIFVELGKSRGLTESSLVLVGPGLLIDQGQNANIHPDQLLTSGRTLIGRTTKVGSMTTLVQPLTDENFKIAVRIVRGSQFGAVKGPMGILVGTGEGCRLDEVSAREAVAVGDYVYTEPTASPTGIPIFCGVVESAEIAPTSGTWTVQVTPAHPPRELPSEVQVLVSRLNPERVPNEKAAP